MSSSPSPPPSSAAPPTIKAEPQDVPSSAWVSFGQRPDQCEQNAPPPPRVISPEVSRRLVHHCCADHDNGIAAFQQSIPTVGMIVAKDYHDHHHGRSDMVKMDTENDGMLGNVKKRKADIPDDGPTTQSCATCQQDKDRNEFRPGRVICLGCVQRFRKKRKHNQDNVDRTVKEEQEQQSTIGEKEHDLEEEGNADQLVDDEEELEEGEVQQSLAHEKERCVQEEEQSFLDKKKIEKQSHRLLLDNTKEQNEKQSAVEKKQNLKEATEMAATDELFNANHHQTEETRLPISNKKSAGEETNQTTTTHTVCSRCQQADSEFWNDQNKGFCLPCAVLIDARNCAARAIVQQLMMKKTLELYKREAQESSTEDDDDDDAPPKKSQAKTKPKQLRINWSGSVFCMAHKSFIKLMPFEQADQLTLCLGKLMSLTLVRGGRRLKDWYTPGTLLLGDESFVSTSSLDPDTESLPATYSQCSICKEAKSSKFTRKLLSNEMKVDMCKQCSVSREVMVCHMKELAANAFQWFETEQRTCVGCKQTKDFKEYSHDQWRCWQSYCKSCHPLRKKIGLQCISSNDCWSFDDHEKNSS